ncbi:MAG: hypothetical protein WBG48_16170, partial [Pricia sp.]
MKNFIVILMFLVSGLAIAQTTVTLEDQCNCEVLSGTAVTTAGMTSPGGADTGDIYVNTDTGTIYFWDGGSWELTSTDSQQLQTFSFDSSTNQLTLVLENGGSVSVDLSGLSNIGTDNQALTLTAGNILTLEDGGTVNLTPFLDNTDDQQVTDFTLDNATNELTLTLEDGGTETVDFTAILAAAGTDDQALTLTAGNILTLEDGGTVNLTPFLDNSDDQTITDFSLDGTTNIITLTLENGGTQTIDLSGFVSTDDQNISGSGLSGTDLTIGIENGTNETVDLSSLVGTDDQALTITGNTLTLEDGGTVDLTPYLDNTDDQTVTDFSIDNTTNVLTITLEDGNTQIVDLSVLDNAGTDNQNLTLTGTNLSIEDGNTVDLSGFVSTDDQNLTLTGNTLEIEDGNNVDLGAYLDNTDDQNIENLGLTGNTLTVGIEGGTAQTVDLSALIGTDNQNIENLALAGNTLTVGIENGTSQNVDLSSLVGTDDQTITAFSLDNITNVLTITLENGNTQTVDLSALDNAGTDDQNISGSGLSGTDLTIGIENGTNETVDLSSLVGTDDQSISLAGNTLTLEDGGTVDLAPYLDNTDDQAITDFSLNGATNIITLTLEDGGTHTVDLSGFVSTDDQNIENLGLAGNILTVGIENGSAQTVDLSAFDDAGTDDQNLTLTGNTLEIEDGNDVDLSGYLDNTDDQNISGSGLSGTDLTIGIENGTNETIDLSSLVGTDDQTLSLAGNTLTLEDGGTVDLSAYLDNTDNQRVTDFSLDNTTNELTLTLEDGGTETVDFTAVLAAADTNTTNDRLEISGSDLELEDSDGNVLSVSLGALAAATDTDDQALTLEAGNVLTLEDGGTVNLTPFLDNTDDQQVTDFSLDNTTNELTLTLEDGGTETVDFTAVLAAAGTDNQALTLAAGNILTLEDGGTVDLTPYLDNTDDQAITDFSLDGATNIVTLTLEDGGTRTLDLSGFVSTDNQNISGSGLTGTDLTIGIENGTNEIVDLSSLVGTDDQAISLTGNTLTLEDGGTVDLSTYLDNTDNQTITAFAIDSTTNVLTITLEDGNTQTVDLSALDNAGTDDQNLTLTGTDLSIEDGNTVDLSGFVSTDDQDLTLTGNTLEIEDGNNVDLSGFLDNTDDQNIESLGLAGNTLTVGIENGMAQTVDLSALVGTDNQNIENLALAGNTLTVGIEDGTSQNVDLSSLVGTDDQAISLVGNILTLENGGTVDLSTYLDNTDNQAITDFSLDGTTNIVTLTLEDGGTQTIDLSGFISTDDQAISLTGNTLTLEDGGTADLSGYLDNTDNQDLTLTGTDLSIENGNTVDLSGFVSTDDQNISGSGLSGTDLTIGIENGTNETIDLSSLVGTDDQAISLVGNILTLEDGGTVNLTPYLDDTDNQTVTDFTLGAGDILSITLQDGNTRTVDLSSLNNIGTDDQTAAEVSYDNTTSSLTATEVQSAINELAAGSTDNQNLSTDGTAGNISIEDGNSISINVNDADADLGNEFNTAIATTTGNLAITDNGGTLSTSLISADANNDIAAGTDGALYLNVSSVTISETITNLTDTNDGFVTYVNESGATQKVAKANITDNSNGTYTFTNNDGSDVILDTRASSNPYDNSTSGLTATNTQAALDELSAGSTDDQNLTLAGNILTLEDGGTVNLSTYLDNTDDQTVTDFTLGAGDILTITLEDGNTRTVDLSSLNDNGSDDQQLTLATNTLTLEDGGTVDLSGYLDNTDDQNLTLTGTDLSIGNGNTVDLSG